MPAPVIMEIQADEVLAGDQIIPMGVDETVIPEFLRNIAVPRPCFEVVDRIIGYATVEVLAAARMNGEMHLVTLTLDLGDLFYVLRTR